MTKSHFPSRQAAVVTEDDAEDFPAGTPTTGKRWSLPMRLIASALISFQVMAIFWPPFTFASRAENGSSSPFADGVMSWFRPYVSFMFLDHGYFFFAPNPGPSHLVQYKVEFADGRKPVEGVFPNLQEEQPRLLYHRHFMLSEFLNNLAIDESRPELFRAVTLSYSEHLRHQHQAAEVTLHLRRHYLPSPQHVSSGKRLDAIELFAERPLGSNSAERR